MAAVLRSLLLRLLLISGFGLLALVISKRLVDRRYLPQVHTVSDAPHLPAAIVFGAGLRWDGSPTPVLFDRVKVAADLYLAGKVDRLLLSGSLGANGRDEPAAMRRLALELGVPAEAILVDDQGTRTLRTCLRARTEFGIQAAALVTQRYHLPRALATCEGLGLQAIGVAADLRAYHPRALAYWELREVPATAIALLETQLHSLLDGLAKPRV
jgi:vancomycin permeability regulator SanA